MSQEIKTFHKIDTIVSAAEAPLSLKGVTSPAVETSAATSFDPEMFYRVGSFVQQRNARELLGLSQQTGDLNILDLGCADGEFAKELLFPRCGKSGKLTGIDLSADMIEKAQNLITADISERVKFLIGDLTKLEDLGMPRNSFNLALSNFVLHWLDLNQSVEFLKGLKPHLAKDGELLCCFPVEGTYQELISAATQSIRHGRFSELFSEEKQKHFNFPSPESFRDAVTGAGYEIADIYQKEVWRPFRSASDLGEWFLYTMSPFTFGMGKIEPYVRRQLTSDIVEEYSKNMTHVSDYPQADNILFVRDLTLVVRALNKAD
jgi:trans-aconitate methyltransferase